MKQSADDRKNRLILFSSVLLIVFSMTYGILLTLNGKLPPVVPDEITYPFSWIPPVFLFLNLGLYACFSPSGYRKRFLLLWAAALTVTVYGSILFSGCIHLYAAIPWFFLPLYGILFLAVLIGYMVKTARRHGSILELAAAVLAMIFPPVSAFFLYALDINYIPAAFSTIVMILYVLLGVAFPVQAYARRNTASPAKAA